jgi:hypothetical protein
MNNAPHSVIAWAKHPGHTHAHRPRRRSGLKPKVNYAANRTKTIPLEDMWSLNPCPVRELDGGLKVATPPLVDTVAASVAPSWPFKKHVSVRTFVKAIQYTSQVTGGEGIEHALWRGCGAALGHEVGLLLV